MPVQQTKAGLMVTAWLPAWLRVSLGYLSGFGVAPPKWSAALQAHPAKALHGDITVLKECLMQRTITVHCTAALRGCVLIKECMIKLGTS